MTEVVAIARRNWPINPEITRPTLSGARIATLNYGLAVIAAAGTYAMMVMEAGSAGQWTHIVTLTPLLPYLVTAALAYRHRVRPRFGGVIAGLTAATAIVGLPLFWTYYVPEHTPPATRVMIKIILPIIQAVVILAVGAILEMVLLNRTPSETKTARDVEDS